VGQAESILDEHDPPKSTGRALDARAALSMQLSFVYGVVVNGINCHEFLITVLFIAPFNGGSAMVF